MFQGFTEHTGEYLWELSFHNERPWFNAHREEYERDLHIPFKELARAVYDRLSALYPDTGWQVHISRIARDARRLYGRPPYKDHLWFTIWNDNGSDSGPAFWFEISPRDYNYGVGFWMAKAAHMESFRQTVLANPARFERLVLEIGQNPRFSLLGEEYRKPKGDLGDVLNPWFNRKYLALQCQEDFGGDLFSPSLPDRLVHDFIFLMPMYEFFCEFYRPFKGGET